MNRESRKNQKGKSKRTMVIAIIIFIVSCFVGAGTAILESYLDDQNTNLAEIARNTLAGAWKGITAVSIIIIIAITACMVLYYMRARRMERNMNPEDDSAAFEIEKLISKMSIIMSAGIPILFLASEFAMYSIWEANSHRAEGDGLGPIYYVALLVFVIGAVVMYFTYKKVVDMEMRLNPERHGDIYSLFFHRQWENSADEAQKLMMYRAGYESYIVMLHLAIILELISMVTMRMFQTGLLPCIYIFLIWIAGQWVYAVKEYRMETGEMK